MNFVLVGVPLVQVHVKLSALIIAHASVKVNNVVSAASDGAHFS